MCLLLFETRKIDVRQKCHLPLLWRWKKFFCACVRRVHFIFHTRQRHIINHEMEEFFFHCGLHRHTFLVSRCANLKENCATKMNSISSDKEEKRRRRTMTGIYGKYAADLFLFYLFSRINEAIAHLATLFSSSHLERIIQLRWNWIARGWEKERSNGRENIKRANCPDVDK